MVGKGGMQKKRGPVREGSKEERPNKVYTFWSIRSLGGAHREITEYVKLNKSGQQKAATSGAINKRNREKGGRPISTMF